MDGEPVEFRHSKVEVGPDGMRLPEMGGLPWHEIASVRLETMHGVGGGGRAVVSYRRLGVVPRDPRLEPSLGSQIGWGIFGLYAALVRTIAPGTPFGVDDPAPFGVGEPTLSPAEFDTLLATTRRYVTVVDVAAERARRRAPGWAARAARKDPLTVADIAALDAGLAVGSTRADAGAVAILDGAGAEPPPRAVFTAPHRSLVVLAVRAVAALAGIAIFYSAFVPAAGRGAPPVFLLMLAVPAVIILIAGLRPLLAELRRRRRIGASRSILEIGPDGIRLLASGLVAWPDVADVRAERVGFTSGSDGPPLERWRLVVIPGAGPAVGRAVAVESDLLEAPFEEVVGLVRFYHPVVEVR